MTLFRIAPTLGGLMSGAAMIAAAPAAAQYGYPPAYQNGPVPNGGYQNAPLPPAPQYNDPYQQAPYHNAPYQQAPYYNAADPRVPYQEVSYDEEIVVEGHYRNLQDAPSLSQPVSYADLDLRYDADRAILRRRISLTARDLCKQLGEHEVGRTIVPTCQQTATSDALRRLGTIDQTYIPRDSVLLQPRPVYQGYADPRYAQPYRSGWDR